MGKRKSTKSKHDQFVGCVEAPGEGLPQSLLSSGFPVLDVKQMEKPMKARIIHTKFYESERVLSLSQQSRWLFMYYLTCSGIGLTGAFKWGDSKTLFETGLDSKGLAKAKEELQASKLVLFYEGWVIVPDTDEKTGYNKGDRTSKAYESEFRELPDTVSSILENPNTLYENDDRVSGFTDTPINHKSEIRNNSSSLVLSSSYKTELAEIKADELFLEELSIKYQVPPSFVLSKLDDLENWIEEKPSRARGRNLRRTLPAWVKKDAIQAKKGVQYGGKPTLTVIPGAS